MSKVVQLRNVHPKFVFGSGKTSEMSGAISAADADTVFVNAPLSGQQQKALSAEWGGATVLDRFAVILDIFADRARTTEAKLQARVVAVQLKRCVMDATSAAVVAAATVGLANRLHLLYHCFVFETTGAVRGQV